MNILEKKVATTFSIKKKVKVAFDLKCEKLVLDKNLIAEELLKNFINNK